MAVQIDGSTAGPSKGQSIQLYHLSSQHWRFSVEQLEKIRQELNEQAVDRVRTLWEEERAQQAEVGPPKAAADTPAEGSTSAPPSQPTTPPPPSEIEYLTVEDEQALVGYYLQQAVGLCGAFKFPEVVLATALSYLKRFYLRNTSMDYHPKDIMRVRAPSTDIYPLRRLTCVFLATKTENCGITIDMFAGRVKVEPASILALEFLVSQSLHFEYKIHHAHLALSGLVLDMQTAGVPSSRIAAALPRAQSTLRTARLSAAELVYPPSQIALACMRIADREAVETWLQVRREAAARARKEAEERLARMEREQKGAEGEKQRDDGAGEPPQLEHEGLLHVLDAVQTMIQERKTVSKERATEIDRRLKWARNPEKDPKSALYKKRKAEEEAAREEKDRAKAAQRPANDDASVFD
ncbi:hypothetical protein JCM10450v2_004867 [Rhodotorula kratochvilovae]